MKKGHVKLFSVARTYNSPAQRTTAILDWFPYMRSGQGSYVHHIRSGLFHEWIELDVPPHRSFDLWCGMTLRSGGGQTGNRPSRKPQPEFFVIPPRNAVVCATCQGRAIGAGLDKSRRVHGHFISFRPRV